MQAIFEFLPLILFLGGYFYKGIYFALGLLMVAMPVGVLVKYVMTRKLDKMYFWSTVFLLIAGSATFYFDNPKFLYWKPTAFYWVVAIAFLASLWIGERPLVQRVFQLSGGIETQLISTRRWAMLNLIWVAFFIGMGALNIYVAYNYPEPFWVKFKVFGLMGLTIVFMVAQSFWIFSKLELADDGEKPGTE